MVVVASCYDLSSAETEALVMMGITDSFKYESILAQNLQVSVR